jgi:hypothetical protein
VQFRAGKAVPDGVAGTPDVGLAELTINTVSLLSDRYVLAIRSPAAQPPKLSP